MSGHSTPSACEERRGQAGPPTEGPPEGPPPGAAQGRGEQRPAWLSPHTDPAVFLGGELDSRSPLAARSPQHCARTEAHGLSAILTQLDP